jgi:hypothetical protein
MSRPRAALEQFADLGTNRVSLAWLLRVLLL